MHNINLGDISNTDAIINFKSLYESSKNIDEPLEISQFFNEIILDSSCILTGTTVMPFKIMTLLEEEYCVNVEVTQENRDKLESLLSSINYSTDNLTEIPKEKISIILEEDKNKPIFFIGSKYYI